MLIYILTVYTYEFGTLVNNSFENTIAYPRASLKTRAQ